MVHPRPPFLISGTNRPYKTTIDNLRDITEKYDVILLDHMNGSPVVILSVGAQNTSGEQADAIALKNAVARGALLEAAAVEREWTSVLAGVRAGVLAASSRIGQRLPHLPLEDITEIDAELRELLTGLGGDL